MAEQASVRVSDPPKLQTDLGAELSLPGRSQAALARHMGLDSSAVNRIVTGLRQIKLSEAGLIEEYLSQTARAAPTSPLAMKIAARLRAVGMTARAASIKAGLGPDAIRSIFNGSSQSPRGETLGALAAVLGCSVDYLLGEDGEPPALPAPATDAITITQSDTGMWFATRENDRPLFVAAKTLAELCAILPEAVRRAG